MALDPDLRQNLVLPAICAPMFFVTGVDLVREACKAGIIGVLPRHNLRSIEAFDAGLGDIRRDLERHRQAHPASRIGPLGINLAKHMSTEELDAHLEVSRRHGVQIIISATFDPTELIRRAHDLGMQVFHDVVTLRHAHKAIAAGADGLTCVGAGGGGHSGVISHLALIPKIREIFDGVITMAGAISNGAGIRAAEILGADLAYLGTRFIATQEADADPAYKNFLVSETSADLLFTGKISGVPANWMKASMRAVGLDPENLPEPKGKGISKDHLPASVVPWKNLWSAGQGIDLIHDIPSVAELVRRLRREYVAACAIPHMADVARLVDEASDRAARAA